MDCLNTLKRIYYFLKPIIPRRLQIGLRRFLIKYNRITHRAAWPILELAGEPPEKWLGWPFQKRFAFVLTHDVETASGRDKCPQLAEIESELGFRSSFNFVPERYRLPPELRKFLTDNGFEVGVHGLNHDGHLFLSRRVFDRRSKKINQYLKTWKAVGFRSPSMHHVLEWMHDLNIAYDCSTFDTNIADFHFNNLSSIFPKHIKKKTVPAVTLSYRLRWQKIFTCLYC